MCDVRGWFHSSSLNGLCFSVWSFKFQVRNLTQDDEDDSKVLSWNGRGITTCSSQNSACRLTQKTCVLKMKCHTALFLVFKLRVLL